MSTDLTPERKLCDWIDANGIVMQGATPSMLLSAAGLDALTARAIAAEAKLARVRELHQPFAWENVHGEAQAECTHCIGEYDGSVHYPCPTIRALDGAE